MDLEHLPPGVDKVEYRVVWADDWMSKVYSLVDAKKAIEHHAERRLPARIEARYVSNWVEVSDESTVPKPNNPAEGP